MLREICSVTEVNEITGCAVLLYKTVAYCLLEFYYTSVT